MAKTWILIVEDVRDQAELWSDVCARAGLNSTTAATGLQDTSARWMCAQRSFCSIWHSRTSTDGKFADDSKRIRVVMLTAYDDPRGASRATAAGCARISDKAVPAGRSDRGYQKRSPAAGGIMTIPAADAPIAEAIERLKNLFAEVPGTQLSALEASRLSGLEPNRCQPVLDTLVSIGFLACTANGRFRRPSRT